MKTRHRHKLLLCAATCVLLGSCTVPVVNDPTELDQPMFGKNQDTTYFMQPGNGQVKVRDLAAIARVIRKYKTLEAAEKELIRLAVKRKIDGLIALEAKIIERQPQYVQARKRIAAMPDRKAAVVETKRLEEEILRAAARRVADRLASLAAVPVKTAENRSIVAFAKVSDGQIQVADNAYEVDTPGSLQAGAKVAPPPEAVADLGTTRNVTATMLEVPPVPVTPP